MKTRSIRRVVTSGAVLAFAAAVGVTTSVDAHGATKHSGLCTVEPAANSLAYDAAALVSTIHVRDGTVETLHRVTCTDGRTGFIWVGADII